MFDDLRRGLILRNVCLLCLKYEELVTHILLRCSFTFEVWSALLDILGVSKCLGWCLGI